MFNVQCSQCSMFNVAGTFLRELVCTNLIKSNQIRQSRRTAPFLYEWKCLTPYTIVGLQGRGCPSTVDGGRFAFGGTEESMRRKVYGLLAIGSPGDRPFDRTT